MNICPLIGWDLSFYYQQGNDFSLVTVSPELGFSIFPQEFASFLINSVGEAQISVQR